MVPCGCLQQPVACIFISFCIRTCPWEFERTFQYNIHLFDVRGIETGCMRNWNVFPSQLRPRTDNGRINYGEAVVRKLPSGFRSFWRRQPCLPVWTRRTRFDFLQPCDASIPLHRLVTLRQVSGHGSVWWELRLLLGCKGWSRDRISVGARFSSVQTCPGAHPASCMLGAGSLSRG
jgi:hypothetical protein